MTERITVVGSINMDIVATTGRYPSRGETVFGDSVHFFPGGKGANQAVTCHRLGKETYFIGAVGDDIFGRSLIKSLEASGLNISYVRRLDGAATGVAMTTIDETAENTMLVVKGANDLLTAGDIEKAAEAIDNSGIVLLQMEVPQEAVMYTLKKAKAMNKWTIADPSPAEGITFAALPYCDVIIPNRQETAFLTGIDVTDVTTAGAAARQIQALGVKHVIIKMGNNGCLVRSEGREQHFPAVNVQAVDTVGAGDAFSGAVASAFADGAGLLEAAEFATIVGGLSTTKLGAQSGLPKLQEVQQFSRENKLSNFLLDEAN
ncbi:ribokinase [Evansella caseinilytica]|uniref:Ribokinase n=1 Tax=Evansella caseinilytica TaxID=1503961 RepID=A0A1H3H8C9_9BACI|nr:ribokinase [Evansella caseinilytica]SDY11138.1 ribokinase [Evansella caseinilytica]